MHVLVVHSDPRFFHEINQLIVARDATASYLSGLSDIKPQMEAQYPDLIVLEQQCLSAGAAWLADAFRRTQRLPVLFLTTADCERMRSGDEYDRLAGLLTHLRNQTDQRRSSQITQIGQMRIHGGRMRVALGERWVRLPPIQFRILHHLAQSPNTAIAHRELIEVAWGAEAADDEDRRSFLKVHIMQLRRTLGPEFKAYIQTVRGQGYALVDPNSDD